MAELTWEVRVGDSRELLRELPDASVDSIVCDPPYELGFMGRAWDSSGIAYSVPLWAEVLRVLKPGGHLLAFGGSRTYHRMACAIEDAGFQIRDSLVWIYGSGFPKSLNVAKAGAGEAWSGWGTALKPAQEPIVMARKPLAGTVEANVREYGTGAINVDGCRILHAGADDLADMASTWRRYSAMRARASGNPSVAMRRESRDGQEQHKPSSIGRWPANVLLGHSEACGGGCAEGCPVAELDRQSGTLKSGAVAEHHTRKSTQQATGGGFNGKFGDIPLTGYGDSGGASRFFYVAKPSASERDAGLEHLPTRAGHEVCDREEGSAGASNPRAGIRTQRRNTHPTVKPIEIMRYLVRLVTPPGGLVLDPFTGSGTTGCAAVLEDRRFLGFELEPAHAEIARARIAHWAPAQAELWPAAE